MTSRWAPGVEAKRDALWAKYPDRTFGKVKVQRTLEFIYPQPAPGKYTWQAQITDVTDTGTWGFTMDHQCDEFQIGGIEDAHQLISDLQAAINYCSSFDEPKDRT